MFTPADIDDREPLKSMDFVKEIYGKLVGDKGYISKELFRELFVDGIQLITKVKSNTRAMGVSPPFARYASFVTRVLSCGIDLYQ